jgi:hypothetical protein
MGRQYRVFVKDREPRRLTIDRLLATGSTPPKLTSAQAGAWEFQTTGHQGLFVYNMPDRDLSPGGAITWRVVIEGNVPDPHIESTYMVYDTSIVDPSRTNLIVDTALNAQHVIGYSGILTLIGKSLSKDTKDGILVGILSSKAGLAFRVREFRVAVYQ